ncbi:p21-activated protein kinase-interacting protein 1-like [Trichonephila clavipes]|nr:p21-activated protein kinase-interacting protein 1-like [Trichonephila clavipes]
MIKLSSGEDKNICIWSTKNWQCEKTLRGHKDTINSFAIHPTGKMALSVGKDKTLRTWNLIKGRSAYVTNTKNAADIVRWTPDGSHFLVSSGTSIDVYSVEKATIVSTVDFHKKICDFTFIKLQVVLRWGPALQSGGEKGALPRPLLVAESEVSPAKLVL